jgi:hypothetical protein
MARADCACCAACACGHKGGVDVEDPACARATFVGYMRRVPQEDEDMARSCMFARHPQMEAWPADHRFLL